MQVVYWRVFWGSTPTEGKGRGEKGWAGVIRADAVSVEASTVPLEYSKVG